MIQIYLLTVHNLNVRPDNYQIVKAEKNKVLYMSIDGFLFAVESHGLSKVDN